MDSSDHFHDILNTPQRHQALHRQALRSAQAASGSSPRRRRPTTLLIPNAAQQETETPHTVFQTGDREQQAQALSSPSRRQHPQEPRPPENNLTNTEDDIFTQVSSSRPTNRATLQINKRSLAQRRRRERERCQNQSSGPRSPSPTPCAQNEHFPFLPPLRTRPTMPQRGSQGSQPMNNRSAAQRLRREREHQENSQNLPLQQQQPASFDIFPTPLNQNSTLGPSRRGLQNFTPRQTSGPSQSHVLNSMGPSHYRYDSTAQNEGNLFEHRNEHLPTPPSTVIARANHSQATSQQRLNLQTPSQQHRSPQRPHTPQQPHHHTPPSPRTPQQHRSPPHSPQTPQQHHTPPHTPQQPQHHYRPLSPRTLEQQPHHTPHHQTPHSPQQHFRSPRSPAFNRNNNNAGLQPAVPNCPRSPEDQPRRQNRALGGAANRNHNHRVQEPQAFFCIARRPYHDPPQRHDLGPMNIECHHCHALHWSAERLAQSSKSNPKFGMCCNQGSVDIPLLEAPPEPLWTLYTSDNREAKNFRELSWKYNRAFSFTSLGVNEDHSVNRPGRGPPVFQISGELCHRSGALATHNGHTPRYAQLYIYEPRAALDARMQQNADLNRDTMGLLQHLLLEHHQYAPVYRHAYEVLQNYDPTDDVCIRLRVAPGTDRRRYNLPTADEVAVILPGNPSTESRDIILRHRDGPLYRVSELHPAYSPLQYPILFPYGQNGWHPNLMQQATEGNNGPRLSETRYCAFRLQVRRDEFSTILRGGRLFQRYIVDMFAAADQNRLRYVTHNQSKLRASLYGGLEDALAQADGADGEINLRELGQRVILPSSYIGGPRNMHQRFQDSMAIARYFRKVDAFITVTTNPHWVEIERELLPGQTAYDRPDLVARVFQLKKKAIMEDIYKNRVYGHAVAYVYTIEFQKRGLPHMHCLIFFKELHKLLTPAAINECISARWPDPVTEPLLFETVKKCMVHENGRQADPKNTASLALIFDAHIYLGDQTQALASLRYFNASNLDFDDVQACFLTANVAKVPSNAKGITSSELKNEDYSLVGDIVSLIPTGLDVNLRNRPFINISGSVERIDEKKHNFDLAPEQYVAACKDISGKPTFPAQCRIPDTARWKDRVPKVKAGSYVSVGGFLSGIIRNDKNGIKQFVIEVEKITFLGRAPITPRAIEGSLETPVKQGKGLKFDYNSPSPLSSKRRRVEPGSSSSSIIEPELLQ